MEVPRPYRGRASRPVGPSYKYQRLRERLREAIAQGELSGKLPGERVLAQRFKANAKTLSKALTDLAAEGLLDRSVGRGTFVKGAKPASAQGDRWMIVCDADQAGGAIVRALMEIHPDSQIISDTADLRPSLINRFAAALVLSHQVSESVLRDLTIRNVPLLLLNREPAAFSVRAVVVDTALAASRLARHLVLEGHRRLVVVEQAGLSPLVDMIRQAAQKVAPDSTVDALSPDRLDLFPTLQCTSLVCASVELADRAIRIKAAEGSQNAAGVAITAIGVSAQPPCSGYFVDPRQIAQACVDYLKDAASAAFSTSAPSTLWLAASWHEVADASPTHWMGEEARITAGEPARNERTQRPS